MDQSLVFLFVVVMLFVLLMLSICVPLNYMAKELAREIEERNGNAPKSGHVTMTEMVGEPIPSGVIPAPITHYPDNRIPAAEAVAGFKKALKVLSEDSK